MTVIRSIAINGFRALPPRWRERVKALAGALGHQPGWAHRLRADALAAGVKRLDRRAVDIAGLLAFGGVQTLEDLSCLEFGTGHLLPEALLYRAAGARRAMASDYFAIVQRDRLARVWTDADESVVARTLAPHDVDAFLVRLDRLKAAALAPDPLAALEEEGVIYRAPYDAAHAPMAGEQFDLITSTSVMEHVPADQAAAILRNLAAMLSPGGVMIHGIHLEDHRDFNDPHAFLTDDTDWTVAQADSRGNRLRASEWRSLHDALPDCRVINVSITRFCKPLPPRLDPRFAAFDPDDLAASGITIAIRRAPA